MEVAEILTGNSGPVGGAVDAPLVTFAILSYNQERYIEKALCSALAQEGLSLEIIVSDDASSDGTWDRVCALTAKYSGPHHLVLNRNEANLGIGGHIRKIGSLASGEIIVLAGGDDMSKPERTRELVRVFLASPETMAVFSDCVKSTEDDQILGIRKTWVGRNPVPLDDLVAGGGGVGLGATYAYRRRCFFWPEGFPEWLASGDRILPLRAGLLGVVQYLPLPLVVYRVTAQSTSRRLQSSRLTAKFRFDHLEVVKQHLELAYRERNLSSSQHNSLVNQLSAMIRRARRMHRYDALRGIPALGNVVARLYYRLVLS